MNDIDSAHNSKEDNINNPDAEGDKKSQDVNPTDSLETKDKPDKEPSQPQPQPLTYEKME